MSGRFDPSAPSILFDLELTAWEGSLAANWSRPGEWREVIQIGAVSLGPGPELAEHGAFTCLVRPERNPILSDYIVALTGITQAAIERAAVPFPEALAGFDAFVNGHDGALYFNGGDADILAENAGWHGIAPSRHAARMVDIRGQLRRMLDVGQDNFSSIDVPALAGVETPEGQRHDALNDVRAIAAGLRALIVRGAF